VFGKAAANAAPRPFRTVFDEAGSDRVVEDVVDRSEEVILISDQPRGEAGTEQMARPITAAIELLGVRAVEILDAGREIRLRGPDEDVDVRPHQAEGVDAPRIAVDRPRKAAQVVAPIIVVAVEERVGDRDCRDVEEPVGERRTEDARHSADASAPPSRRAPLGMNRNSLDTLAVSPRAIPGVRPQV
jgi:hypothetical protein